MKTYLRCLGAGLGFALCAAGCSSSGHVVSADEWKIAARSHVDGAPGVEPMWLAVPDADHPVLLVIGASDPTKSTDVSGVLVAKCAMQGREWKAYLVGTVKDRQIQEIHISMMTDSAGAAEWRDGASNPASVKQYRESGVSPYRVADPKGKITPAPEWFPREQDVFRCETSDDTVTITEENSHASWTLSFSQPATANGNAQR